MLAFAGLGWYLDWYKIHSEPAGEGHRHVNIDFNQAPPGDRFEIASGGGGGFLISSITLVSMGARTTSTTFFARPVTNA